MYQDQGINDGQRHGGRGKGSCGVAREQIISHICTENYHHDPAMLVNTESPPIRFVQKNIFTIKQAKLGFKHFEKLDTN